jgi:hypothetical protein
MICGLSPIGNASRNLEAANLKVKYIASRKIPLLENREEIPGRRATPIGTA